MTGLLHDIDVEMTNADPKVHALKAEELLKEHKFIVKCHRSFMVNIDYIDRFEGNLQGYKLYFEHIDFPIPVSKSFASKLQELI